MVGGGEGGARALRRTNGESETGGANDKWLPPVTFFCFPPVPMTTPASPPAGPPFGIDDALDQAERALGLTPAVGGR